MNKQELEDYVLNIYSEVQALWKPSEMQLPVNPTPQQVYDILRDLRTKISRFDPLYGNLIIIWNKAKTELRTARTAYDDVWEEAVRSTSTVEYSSAREREAVYALKTFAQRKALREAEKWEQDVSWMKDYLEAVNRSIQNYRRDLDLVSRMISDEVRLSR